MERFSTVSPKRLLTITRPDFGSIPVTVHSFSLVVEKLSTSPNATRAARLGFCGAETEDAFTEGGMSLVYAIFRKNRSLRLHEVYLLKLSMSLVVFLDVLPVLRQAMTKYRAR